MLLDVWIKRIVGVYRLHGVDHQGLRHLVDLQLFKVKHVKYSIGACGFRGLLTRSPRGRTSTNRILPRCARDVFCSSPFVSLRLPTDFSQNPSPSIFLLRREGDCVTAIPKGEAITKKSCLAPLGMSFVRVLM